MPRNAPVPMVVVEVWSEDLEAPLVSGLTKVQAGMVVDLSVTEPDQSEWAVLLPFDHASARWARAKRPG